jgi:CBS domain-containing protein
MIDRDIGSVVVAEGESAVGVFTERDLTRQILDDSGLLDRKVREVMSSPVTTVGPDDEVVFVFRLMNDKGIRRLPVVPRRPAGGEGHGTRPPPVGPRAGQRRPR